MRVLVACEYSGRVRDAFTAAGHFAVSCDLLPSDRPDGLHYQGDVRDLLREPWDLMIAHPPCTYLTVAGIHWNKRGVLVAGRPRSALTEDALDFVRELMAAPIPMKAIENPVSIISSRIRPPDQIIQPYEFGEDASKKNLSLAGGPASPACGPSAEISGSLGRVAARFRSVCRALGQSDRQRTKPASALGKSMEGARRDLSWGRRRHGPRLGRQPCLAS